MTDDLGDVTTVKLEAEQIRQLNALYNSVTDYTNSIPFEYPDTYELDNGYRCHAYYCYTLRDRQTDQRVQYTLCDYTQEGDWLYTYGNAGYLKLQVSTGETVAYEAFEDIPTQEQPLFDRVDDTDPIREVTLLTPHGMRHEGCEITEGGYIGEERIVGKIALTDITLERFDGSCQP